MANNNLDKYLFQLRRIEEHRTKAAEREIRKIYKDMLKDLQGYLGGIYANYAGADGLTYPMLAAAGIDARFLEEVEQRINNITPTVSREITKTVEDTYIACYDGMLNSVAKAAGDSDALRQAFSTVRSTAPEVLRAAVNNPISGLTLKDTLEKNRKDIVYDIKRNIGVGLSNGDRYTTMAKRISSSLDGDYKKAVRVVRTEAHRVRETGYNDAAAEIDTALRNGKSGLVMAKTWHTMRDERVRPNSVYRTKRGWRQGKKGKYDHEKMDGVTIPMSDKFELPSGATCDCPSKTGVAGEDINCRCYISYDLVKESELTKVKDGKQTIEQAVQETERAPEVTKEQKDAVEYYVSGDGMYINHYLRDGDEAIKSMGKMRESDKALIENLDKATDITIPKQKLYRSVDASALFGDISDYEYEDMKSYVMYSIDDKSTEKAKKRIENVIKNKITDKGYMSTTTDFEVASDFGDFTGNNKPIVIEFTTAIDTKGFNLKEYMPELNEKMEQDEVILKRNQSYIIDKINKKDGNIYVKAHFIENN